MRSDYYLKIKCVNESRNQEIHFALSNNAINETFLEQQLEGSLTCTKRDHYINFKLLSCTCRLFSLFI